MTLEVMGLVSFVAGILCLVWGSRFAIHALVFSTLFGAAAASILHFLGSANLPPSFVMLLFVTLSALAHPPRTNPLAWGKPGFWLVLMLGYAISVTIFMPRLMAGLTDVFTFARTDGPTISLSPLAPVSGNITQTAYLVGGIVCFVVVSLLVPDESGKRSAADALILCAAGNVVFATLDYVTYYTGTADVLSVIRNAPYRMLDDAEVMGIKRLVGSFTEASSFASATLALFACMLTLYLGGYRTRSTGLLAALLLACLIASTSATAYVSLTIYLIGVYASGAVKLLWNGVTLPRLAILTLGPLLAITVFCVILMNETTAASLGDLVNKLVLEKGSTDSAAERGAWNAQALKNFTDSWGIGIGIGSARASSTVIAALANIGVLGTAMYALFFVGCLLAPYRERNSTVAVIRHAAASACLALFIGGCIAGTTIDLGLFFFICAAIAASSVAPERAMQTVRSLPSRFGPPAAFGAG